MDTNILPLRGDLSVSVAMRRAYEDAFRSAGLGAPDHTKIAFFDFYSCFPIAVEHACGCVGLDVSSDVCRMTSTGGLPYHGGPGSNYSCHALCAVVEKLRLDHYRDKFGVVGANGGWLTEHSVGIYSTKRPSKTYQRPPTSHAPMKSFDSYAMAPSGEARLLTWTVIYGRRTSLPETGVGIVEMLSGPDRGKRCACMTRASKSGSATVDWLLKGDRIDSTVRVSVADKETKYGKRMVRPVYFEHSEGEEGSRSRM